MTRKLVCIVGFCVWAGLVLNAQMKNNDCLTCHGEKSLEAMTPRGKKLNLFVAATALTGSVHEGMNCTDCHVGATSFENIPHADKPLQLGCVNCHADTAESFKQQDIHGQAIAKGNTHAPNCQNCHGGHQVLPKTSPAALMSRLKQADTCGRCHGSDELNREEGITKRNLITRYRSSVHWSAINSGKTAATCTDCHSIHTIQPSSNANSTVSQIGILTQCQKCHPNEVRTFKNGPHGRTLLRGSHDAPTCTTCHGDHDMASLRMRIGEAKQWAATQVCIWCHNNSKMMARYGLDTTPVESYMNDFHGLTQRGTMGASATCADCHDAHNALPSSHPQSRMFISNRGTTCGMCHGKVSDSFARSFSHRKAMEYSGSKIEHIVRVLYIFIIVFCVVGMLAYNMLIWIWAVRRKYAEQKAKQQIRRLTRFELGSHMALLLSFTLLALTGFALKFPDVFWVRWLFAIGMTEVIRGFIHRMSAFVMVVDLFVFAFYMLFKARGRCVLREIWPRLRDFKDFWASVRYYLGVKMERPRSAVFNFGEKFEFWALIWGTAVMALTGIILWFPKGLPASAPIWVINVARLIHYYEAVLATLAIVIWHGFHTIWHPEEYPMNTSWLTGYITEEDAYHRFEEQAVVQMEPRLAENNTDDSTQ